MPFGLYKYLTGFGIWNILHGILKREDPIANRSSWFTLPVDSVDRLKIAPPIS